MHDSDKTMIAGLLTNYHNFMARHMVEKTKFVNLPFLLTCFFCELALNFQTTRGLKFISSNSLKFTHSFYGRDLSLEQLISKTKMMKMPQFLTLQNQTSIKTTLTILLDVTGTGSGKIIMDMNQKNPSSIMDMPHLISCLEIHHIGREDLTDANPNNCMSF